MCTCPPQTPSLFLPLILPAGTSWLISSSYWLPWVVDEDALFPVASLPRHQHGYMIHWSLSHEDFSYAFVDTVKNQLKCIIFWFLKDNELLFFFISILSSTPIFPICFHIWVTSQEFFYKLKRINSSFWFFFPLEIISLEPSILLFQCELAAFQDGRTADAWGLLIIILGSPFVSLLCWCLISCSPQLPINLLS